MIFATLMNNVRATTGHNRARVPAPGPADGVRLRARDHANLLPPLRPELRRRVLLRRLCAAKEMAWFLTPK